MVDAEKLPDLTTIIDTCKAKIKAIDNSKLVVIGTKKAEELIEVYEYLHPTHDISIVGGHSFVIITGDHTRYISVQEMPTLAILAENANALEAYRKELDDIAIGMKFNSRTGEGSDFFGSLLKEDWDKNNTQEIVDLFISSLNSTLTNQSDRERMLKFVTDANYGGIAKDDGTIGRKLNRSTDWQESAIMKTGGLVQAASAGRINMVRAIEQAGFGSDLVEFLDPPAKSDPLPDFGENVIFYGAPGTGKSNLVDRKVAVAGKSPIRTVFHSDLQNSDFFGSLKPRMKDDSVRYEFAAGPFMTALAEAYRTPEQSVFLVIEELNRAAAAAVFGDLFLLLDRDDAGTGEYTVSFPSPESQAWFEEETGSTQNHIRLPSNMFIYATMNSADHGVYPIDTAFRRRWRQEYLPLDYNSGPEGKIAYVDAKNQRRTMEWRKFVELLNGHLTGSDLLAIAEDRLLGQWFVRKNELDGNCIPEKVLLYIWDDLLRHEGRDHIFRTDIVKTYGALALKSSSGDCFLSDGFIEVLKHDSILDPAKAGAAGAAGADENGAG